MSAEAWDFLKLVVTLIVAPACMWYLNRRQTAKIEPKIDNIETLVNGDRAAKEARIRHLESILRAHGIAE